MREFFSRVAYAISTFSAYYSFNGISKHRYGLDPLFTRVCLTAALCAWWPQSVAAQTLTSPAALSSSGTLADSQLARARSEVEQTERLVSHGTLPRLKLDEARGRLADAEDEALVSTILFGFKTEGSTTEEEAKGMVAAAQRRVERARTVLEERQKLFASGAIARVDVENASQELEYRERTFRFAQERLRLLKELAAMAESERELAKAAESASIKGAVIRSDGNGSFSLNDLTPIQAQFEKTFHRTLPISALGQTLTHQALGLDHKNRVDVALSPTQVEGSWLLQLLNRLHVPYLAFRTAVPGAATAPHIHIGLGSTRLQTVLGSTGAHAVYSPKVR